MINQLIQRIQKTKAPICVGLDPMLGYIPEHVTRKAFDEFGETLEGAAEAIWQFNKEIVDHVYDIIPSVKPQIAMYEQFGIEGLKIYKRTVGYRFPDCESISWHRRGKTVCRCLQGGGQRPLRAGKDLQPFQW